MTAWLEFIASYFSLCAWQAAHGLFARGHTGPHSTRFGSLLNLGRDPLIGDKRGWVVTDADGDVEEDFGLNPKFTLGTEPK